MPRGKTRPVKAEEGAPLWMVTYSDMITLILAFFILLFSFSVVDNAKFVEILSSFRVSLLGSEGVLRGSVDPSPIDEIGEFIEDHTDMDVITFETIKTYIEEAGIKDIVDVFLEDRGIVLEISDAMLFDPAKADLKPESLDVLSSLAEVLRRVDNRIIVEGHTDNVPINTFLFPSNWELSVARAVVVVRFLVEIKGLEPERFAANGHGEFHPVASNLTDEGRAKNRRVNVVISTIDYTGKTGGQQTNEPSG
jgi:chemotaxis protein MotB